MSLPDQSAQCFRLLCIFATSPFFSPAVHAARAVIWATQSWKRTSKRLPTRAEMTDAAMAKPCGVRDAEQGALPGRRRVRLDACCPHGDHQFKKPRSSGLCTPGLSASRGRTTAGRCRARQEQNHFQGAVREIAVWSQDTGG